MSSAFRFNGPSGEHATKKLEPRTRERSRTRITTCLAGARAGCASVRAVRRRWDTGFLSRLFGRTEEATADIAAFPSTDDRQSVVVWLRLLHPDFADDREQAATFALEDRLMAAVDASGTGTFDTNDLQRGSFGMHFLGRDADAMLEVIRPLLLGVSPGSYLAVRRGPPGTSEERMEL